MLRTKKYSIPLAIAILILLLSFFVKVQHWSIGVLIERLSLITIGILYTLRFLKKQKKSILDVFKLVLITSYALVSILMSFQLTGIYYLQRFVMLVALAWVVLEIIGFAKNKFYKLNAILYAGVFIMMIEIAFSVMWWPGRAMLHILGLIIISIGLFIDYSKQYKERIHNTTNDSLLDQIMYDDSSKND